LIELLHTPPSFIRRHWGSWGVLVLTVWALLLGLTTLINLLLTTQAMPDEAISQNQLNGLMLLNGFFSVGFLLSSVSLTQRKNWGRLLFIGFITIWSGANVIALFFMPTITFSNLIVNSLRFIIGGGLSIWYLNLPHIKLIFRNDPHLESKSSDLTTKSEDLDSVSKNL